MRCPGKHEDAGQTRVFRCLGGGSMNLSESGRSTKRLMSQVIFPVSTSRNPFLAFYVRVLLCNSFAYSFCLYKVPKNKPKYILAISLDSTHLSSLSSSSVNNHH